MVLRDGTDVEHEATAEAGITLSDGVRWWGSRIRYRERGTRRWTTFVLVDVHPFDYNAVDLAIRAHAEARR